MKSKQTTHQHEQTFLDRGKNSVVIAGSFDPSAHSENEGFIPAPFTGDVNSSSDQTMERLDEALRATRSEVISEDNSEDDDADDPGQA
jgi:hypothetical protein